VFQILRVRHLVGSASNSRAMRALAICTLMGTLMACAQPPKMMYNWQAYQPGVYAYLKDDGADYAAQAATFEQNIETARSGDQALPPGFHAHLGMLYLKLGSDDKAVEQLQSEKLAFPEATPYVDFSLRSFEAPLKQEPEGGV